MDGRILFVILGIVFGAIGLLLMIYRVILVKKCTSSVFGVVENVSAQSEPSRGGDGGGSAIIYTPTFKYIADGREYIKKSVYGSSHLKLRTGDKVTVFYNPADPKQYYVKEHHTGYLFGAVFFAVGIIAAALFLIF